MYNRLMGVIGRPDLTGPSFAHNHHRVARQAEIEEAISTWTKTKTAEEVEEALHAVGVPAGRVLSVKEIVESPHTKARGIVEDVWVGDEETGWSVKVPKVVPVLEGCDPKTRWAGPQLGQHNHEIFVDELGLNEEELVRLQSEGVIGK